MRFAAASAACGVRSLAKPTDCHPGANQKCLFWRETQARSTHGPADSAGSEGRAQDLYLALDRAVRLASVIRNASTHLSIQAPFDGELGTHDSSPVSLNQDPETRLRSLDFFDFPAPGFASEPTSLYSKNPLRRRPFLDLTRGFMSPSAHLVYR